jgi:hypothetical protein
MEFLIVVGIILSSILVLALFIVLLGLLVEKIKTIDNKLLDCYKIDDEITQFGNHECSTLFKGEHLANYNREIYKKRKAENDKEIERLLKLKEIKDNKDE